MATLSTRRHGIYAVQLGVTASPVIVGGIEDNEIDFSPKLNAEAKSGEHFARSVWLQSQNPRASFTTLALKTALDEIGLTGLDISTLTNATQGLNFFAYKHAKGGTRASGSNHRKYHVQEGIISLGSLNATHQGDAKLAVNVLAQWDGTNDPIVESDSVAVPSGVTDAARWALGGVTIESIALPQVRSLQINFGVKVVSEGNESDVWDSFVTIAEILPTITLTGIDVEWLKAANIPRLGLAVTHANTKIYLRKRLEGGDFKTDVTAEHVKITAAGVISVDKPFDGDGNDAAECSLTMMCSYDGTNDPIVINTASAIT